MIARQAGSSVRAFTITEFLVATMVIGITFAALAVATVTLQRSLFSARDYSTALNTQSRIADYIRRDLRNGLDAGVELAGKRLWIDLPEDYDNMGNPVDPKVGPDRTVVYTTPGARIRMRYYKNGKDFVREGGGGSTVIASNAGDFESNFTELIAAGKLTAIRFTVTYAGKFGTNAAADPIGRKATELTTTLSLRNKPVAVPTPAAPTPAVPKNKRKGR